MQGFSCNFVFNSFICLLFSGSVDVLIVLRRYSLVLTALMLGELLHNQQDLLANIPLLVVVAMQVWTIKRLSFLKLDIEVFVS